MIHFADPYPDELLFSAWVRSAERLQYPNKYAYFAEITGHQRIKPIVDLPCHLDQFVAALLVPSSYPVETLIRDHTLYPYYQAGVVSHVDGKVCGNVSLLPDKNSSPCCLQDNKVTLLSGNTSIR